MKNRVLIEESNFHVDEENKVVVCTLKCNMQLEKHPAWDSITRKMFKKLHYVDWRGKFIVKAKARCNTIDTFDVEVGKRIAESRAKVKMFRVACVVYRLCEDALYTLEKECRISSDACFLAMSKEADHVRELIK